MPIQVDKTEVIAYLQRFLANNKARGMIAELSLDTEVGLVGTPLQDKLYAGGWILSPKGSHYLRHYVYVLPTLFQTEDEVAGAAEALQRDRGWQALATYLTQSRIAVIVSGAVSTGHSSNLNQLQWRNFIYTQERLRRMDDDEPFTSWNGSRGRPSKGSPWSTDVEWRYSQAEETMLTSLGLRQAFYYGYLKQYLQKPIDDPYDVDAFLVSFTGKVMPVEIKEKSRTKNGEFGVDAGRILMLLRLCIATDSNALYTIREIDGSDERNLIGWRFITLADLIMKCRWNLQGGGTGMGGGATQTIMMPSDLFHSLTTTQFSETWLAENAGLQASVRHTAEALHKEFRTVFGDHIA